MVPSRCPHQPGRFSPRENLPLICLLVHGLVAGIARRAEAVHFEAHGPDGNAHVCLICPNACWAWSAGSSVSGGSSQCFTNIPAATVTATEGLCEGIRLQRKRRSSVHYHQMRQVELL